MIFLIILILSTGALNIVWIMHKGRNCAKTRLHWWCKLAVDFPSLNDWAEGGGGASVIHGSVWPRRRKRAAVGDGRGHSCYDGCLAAGQTSYASAFFSLRSISLVGSSAASRPGFNVKSVGSFAWSPLQDGNLLYQTRRSWLFPLENRLVAGVADITVLFCCVGLKGRFLE